MAAVGSRIALAVFDIDGTLLDGQKNVQPGTLKAFAAMREAGTRIMLASGRPIPGLMALAQRHGLGDDLILAGLNGSVVVDQASGGTLATHPLPDEVSAPLIRTGLQHQVLVMLPHEDRLYATTNTHPQVIHEATGNSLTIVVPEDLSAPGIAPTKVLYSAERPILETLEHQLRAEFNDDIELSYSSPVYLEATAAGVDKSTAIRSICEREGIAIAETIAFGDNGNDVNMLEAAGIGVAMGNGIAEAKAAADIVTTSHSDEGIARVLSQHFTLAGEYPWGNAQA